MRAHTSSAWRTAAASAAMVLLGHAALAQPATFTPIPGGPPARFVIARGISANGVWVVGGGGAERIRPRRWSAATGPQILLDPVNEPYEGEAWAASGDGSVVVGEIRRVQGGPLQAFRWTQAGGFQDISAPTQFAQGRGVSDDGAVAMGSVFVGPDFRAYRWTQANGLQLLPPAPGNLVPILARAMSGDGATIIGELSDNFAFRWTAASGTVRLPNQPVPNSVVGLHMAVSRDGQTVFLRLLPTAPPPGSAAWRWTPGDGWRRLSPADVAMTATRADGRVAVGLSLDRKGVLWDALRGGRPFKDELVALGAGGIEGWTGIELTGISADGAVVAGYGITPVPPGGAQSFVATIPRFCYPNCDGSGNPWTPTLTPADFVCFLRKFREGLGGNDTSAIYADCDPAGPLDAADFSCFLREFSAGCR